jgi:dCTP deaminase
MILSSRDISKALKSKKLIIEPPPDETSIDSTTVDLRVGNKFFVWNHDLVGLPGVNVSLDLDNFKFKSLADKYLKTVEPENGKYIIRPAKFYLASTHEHIELPTNSKLAARVEGKSSLARLGLVVHMTAPTIQCGFAGVITLEIFNYGPFPIHVTPGVTKLCQLIIEKVSSLPKQRIGTFVNQKSAKG